MNRAFTSAVALLILVPSTFAFQATEPNATPATKPPATTPAPSTLLTHPLGFSLRHPANWQEKKINGATTLIPDDTPQIDNRPAELYALAAMAATNTDATTQLKSEMTKSLPGLKLTEESSAGDTILLRYQGPEAEPRLAATIRGTTRNNLLIIMLGFGTESAITKHDSLASEVFQSLTPAPRSLDPQLQGTWTNSSSYSSTNFSMASSRSYTLSADGTYRFTSRSAGGTSDVSADSGASNNIGIWAAKDNTITLVTSDGTALNFKYRFVGTHLITTDAANKRTIWSR